MKLSVKSLTITSAVLWGGACLMVAVFNVIWPGYGKAFLDVISSIYPGYEVTGFKIFLLRLGEVVPIGVETSSSFEATQKGKERL